MNTWLVENERNNKDSNLEYERDTLFLIFYLQLTNMKNVILINIMLFCKIIIKHKFYFLSEYNIKYDIKYFSPNAIGFSYYSWL